MKKSVKIYAIAFICVLGSIALAIEDVGNPIKFNYSFLPVIFAIILSFAGLTTKDE